MRESSSRPGVVYYVNQHTNTSQWEKPTGPAPKPATGKVRASHLLVKHRDSRRPASWKSVGCFVLLV